MAFTTYVALALLGLAAVDPLGLGLMPLLLTQPRPFRRCLVFLAGSLLALGAWGMLFARGGGQLLLRVERRDPWLLPAVEAIGGLALLAIAAYLYRQVRTVGHLSAPGARLRQTLAAPLGQLFVAGAVLVSTQSLLDIVFVIAMIRVGQLRQPWLVQLSAVLTYALAALALQVVVIVAYALAPAVRKQAALAATRRLLARYGDPLTIAAALALGLALGLNGLLALAGQPHF